MEKHIEHLQLNAKKRSNELRKLKSKVNVSIVMRENEFRKNLIEEITSVDNILKENKKLLDENKKLKDKLNSMSFPDLDVKIEQ